MQVSAFMPRGSNQSPPVGTVSGAVTTGVTQLTLPGAPYMTETIARFCVQGTSNIAWAYGAQAGLTTSNGVPMLGNTVEEFGIPNGVTQISVIAGSTGSTLSITIGDGL